MATQNSLAKKKSKMTFNEYLNDERVKQSVQRAIGSRSAEFMASISSAVTATPALAECDQASILNAAMIGFALDLVPSPQLGQFYLVPYGHGTNATKIAQFQLGYKGLIQLAIRSGLYRNIDVVPVKEGELIGYDRFRGTVELKSLSTPDEVNNAKTIGYFAYFELLNGFRKEIYWTREQMEDHARRFSKSYSYDIAKGKSSSVWSTNFDAMAQKTMLRSLLSKWGSLSVKMQKGLEDDMKVFNEDGVGTYADNTPDDPIDITPEVPEQEFSDADDVFENQQAFEDEFFG